mmetsp:Transcript_20183/g.71792  ORF Transcript_20183/g.71792 Transcript_20183/m.71792 type:complete len:250 (+) Transcript_20183:259-1008(+)
MSGAFTAETALLHAPKGRRDAAEGARVDGDHAVVESLGELDGAHRVGGHDVRRQPRGALVGQAHGVVEVIEAHQCDDGAKSLAGPACGSGVGDLYDCGRVECRPEALLQFCCGGGAAEERFARLLKGLDHVSDSLCGGGVDERADCDTEISSVADLHQCEPFQQSGFEFVQLGIVDDEAVGADARLARVSEFSRHDRVDGDADVRVRADNKRRVASQLQPELLHRLRALRIQHLPHGRRPRERQSAHRR